MSLRKNIVFGFFFFALSIGSSFAQEGDIISEIKEAIRTGSSKEMARLLNETVDMNIQGKMNNYGKSQAEFILRDFFKKNPPTSFNIIHQGASKSGLPYALGEYKSNNEVFEVWVRVKKVNNRYLINEIRFIKE